MRLNNKVALITGGSTGIGKAITEIFVKEGAKVTIADINKVQGRKTARENKCLSVEGMLGAFGHSAYVTAKSALFGLTKSMAIDFGKFNIRVNSISPGIIDSERPDIKKLKKNKNIMKFWCDMTVLERLGKPIEIANTALFLATDESSYITGQNIAVDGGWTIGHLPINLDET